MINKKEWEERLKQFDGDELDEIAKIINKLKETVDDREEFLSVLRRYSQRYPDAYLFFTGYAGKGAYECEGEWYTGDWTEMCHKVFYEDLFDSKGDKDNDKDLNNLLKNFKTSDDFINSILNIKLREAGRDSKIFKEFREDINNAKHVPTWKLEDADDLENGQDYYTFIDIRTGKTYGYTTNTY